MRILTLILFSLVLLEARTQPTEIREIRLTVTTGDKVVLPSASVALLQKDSTVYRQTVTDANGSAVFENLPLGAYLIRVSSSGYSTKVTRLIDVSKTPTTTETINMEPVAGILGNVVVTSKKPFVQFFPDKTVINVEASINNAGTSIMDVLEKSPGITIKTNDINIR